MQIRYHYVKKEEVKYCPADYTVKQAYELLKETGYRCVPVLTVKEKAFAGLIYKVDLLEHYVENKGRDEDSIEGLISDKDAFIFEEDSFIKTFISIRRLPFLAVLNEKKEFSGIITHANIMDVLEDSFGLKTGGHLLTVATKEHKGAIKDLVTAVKGVNIEGLLTLDNGDKYIRRIIVNLSRDTSEENLNRIIKKLEEKDFRVTYVDDAG
ncbi:CBS domain-containing protein [Bacillus lacus]|uniref:CBS domain-containing protein n=1 Tax=Metabacillus lacus TaxID=1983721 RepID=A0A7X2J1R0_9BACI|nr:cyclic di-AMP binding protein CbpA [Metabacillus lacus]MRX73848.1 CBS domain-containing protein [Metabacillus lacus]